MTDRQFLVCGWLLFGAAMALALPIAWSEMTGRPSPIPTYFIPVAIIAMAVGNVWIAVYRRKSD